MGRWVGRREEGVGGIGGEGREERREKVSEMRRRWVAVQQHCGPLVD